MGGEGEGGQVQTKKCSSNAVIMAVAVNERHRAASAFRQADGSPGRIMCRSRWIAPRRQLRVRRYARVACSGKPQLRTCTLGMPDGRGAGWRAKRGGKAIAPADNCRDRDRRRLVPTLWSQPPAGLAAIGTGKGGACKQAHRARGDHSLPHYLVHCSDGRLCECYAYCTQYHTKSSRKQASR